MHAVKRSLALSFLLASAVAAVPAAAQVATPTPPPVPGASTVTIERIEVHSPALAGNLEGNAADRHVLVVLPPGYASHPDRRYPVLYALHGYSIGVEQWIGEIHVPQTIEGAFANGARGMIVVLPDSRTAHNGSMYSSSATTGDFEAFIARDLVAHIDAHYRTLPQRESRGLAGHSMGGYGTARIGMKHPDVFGALYMMSPCCLSPFDPARIDAAAVAALESLGSPAGSEGLPWDQRALLATASAWSPNPEHPPLYLDLPAKDDRLRSDVLARWTANAPLAFVDQYIGALRGYRAIALDVGDRDHLVADSTRLHEVLDSYGIAHRFEVYPGDHTSGVAGRFQDHVLPFFSEHLAFDAMR